jgi:hypothetical protein
MCDGFNESVIPVSFWFPFELKQATRERGKHKRTGLVEGRILKIVRSALVKKIPNTKLQAPEKIQI